MWSRDIRFARRLADAVPSGRVFELDAGIVVIGPASELTDTRASQIAAAVHSPPYGLVTLDASLPEGERHLVGLSAAVQQSGLAERIGMAQTGQLMQTKMLDYFFTLKNVHGIAYQPIVELATGELVEYECLFRPQMPGLQQSISSVVQAAIDTGRTIELDSFIVRVILSRVGELQAARQESGQPLIHLAINFTPASLLDSQFATLELPQPDENVLTVPVALPVEAIAERVVKAVPHLKSFRRKQ